ncbi:hypothetical protein QFC20_005612 [Naganishia adeliensis]|uniref:Uncharacterized protein n=1 Tax=Naganishia adeliensis TaxID=92952 RepID=A0ACC2VL66_9TREE|nr:hypothetical protein QFC20_005612 [Naganishia adeliensis]
MSCKNVEHSMDIKHIESVNPSRISAYGQPCEKDNASGTSTETENNLTLPDASLGRSSRTNADGFASLTRLRKNLLFIVVTIAMATDTLGTSCLFVSTGEIARDMSLTEGGNAIWIISSYAMAFAACIPLGGRLCDVLPAQWSFLGGFVGMTGLTLGNSFVHERKAFLALRALQGIFAALTVPSGFSMVVHMFPNKEEQRTRLIGCSVIWSFGTISGFIIAMLGWLLMPRAVRARSPATSPGWKSAVEMLKRFDLVGVVLIMAALLLFSLALTSATVYGWGSAKFIAPFTISLVLLPLFCRWEAMQDVRYAMVPVAIMKQPKFLVVCYTGLCAEMWFTITLIGAIIGGLLHTFYLSKKVSAKYRLLAGMVGSIAPGLVLLIVSDGGRGLDYWRYICPAYFMGAVAMV